jgi:hypothetical protein
MLALVLKTAAGNYRFGQYIALAPLFSPRALPLLLTFSFEPGEVSHQNDHF